MQGQPGALELLDVTGAKRALSLHSPTKPTSETALTPHYEDEALFKKANVESDHDNGIPNMGLSPTAGLVHVKTETTARLPPPPAPPATTVDNPVVICDLLSALDTDVVVPGRPSRPLFPRRLPLSLKVHPDIEKIAPEAFQQMRVLHLKHLDTLERTRGDVVICIRQQVLPTVVPYYVYLGNEAEHTFAGHSARG